MLDLLKFKFTANDQTGGSFKKVISNVKGVDGALAKVDERMKRVGKSMRNIGAGLTAGVTAPIALLGVQSIRLYDEQVKAEAAVREAIKSTGGAAGLSADQLGAMASQLQNVTTFGDENILSNVTAPLLTFTKIQSDVFGRAQAATLDMATLLKTDLKSAAVQVGKALNDPIKGVASLGKAGVQFSEDQKKVIKSLVETGRVGEAQALILSELETQFKGQAAAAAATPLGRWTQLSNAIGDVKEQLGGEVAPFLAPLVEKVQSAVAWFSELSPEIKKTIVMGGALAAVVGPIVTVLGLATMGVGALAGAFGTLGAVLLANPIVAIGAVIAGAAFLIYKNWDKIVEWFSEIWGKLSDGARDGWEKIKAVLAEYTPGWLQDHWSGLVAFYGTLWDGITSGIRFSWDIIKGLLSGDYSAKSLIQDAWGGVVGFFSGLWPRVSETFSNFWAEIKEKVSTWPADFLQLGKDMISKLIEGITSKIGGVSDALGSFGGGVRDKVLGLFGGGDDFGPPTLDQSLAYGQGAGAGAALEAGMRDAVETHSPSEVFKRIGGDIMAGLGIGVATGTEAVTDKVKLAGDEMSGALASSPFVDKLMGWIEQSRNFGDFFKNMLADAGKALLKFSLNSAWQGVGSNLAGLTEGGSGGGGGFFSTVAEAIFGAPASSTATPHANGGVFSSPFTFGMGGGKTGLAAENGPEAIMPLTRIGGKLGVRAVVPGSGQGGVTSIVQHFEINTGDGGSDPEAILAALRPVMREEASAVIARSRRERAF